MSWTDMQWNETEQTLELTTRFFIDDLERSIQEGESLHLEKTMDEAIIPALGGFYENGLELYAAGEALEVQFLGYEIEADMVYCYAEVSGVNAGMVIEAKTTWMYDLLASQVNVFNLHKGRDVSALYLNSDKRSGRFEM